MRTIRMAAKSSISKRLCITIIVGAVFAGFVIAGVLVPLKANGLLPNCSWPMVVACPFLCFYLLSGVVVTSLLSDHLGFEPFSAKSLSIDFIYLGIMVLIIVAIVTFS